MRVLQAVVVLMTGLLPAAVESTPASAAPEWIWPVAPGPPVVVRGFDPPAQPWEPGHRGVDLLGTEGAPIRAAGVGVVTYAGPVAGVGVVTVTHGRLRTTYQPVAATVAAGDRVEVGDPIGTLTGAGSHCPPSACLHWGLLRGNTYLDPLDLVERTGRPRLLPLGEQVLRPTVGDSSLHVPASAPTASLEPQSAPPVSGQAALGALAGIR